MLLPLTNQVFYDHLAGQHTIGVYPLLPDDTCFFLAVDFDEADWQEDAKTFMQSCRELVIAAALEISRSGNGAHAWIFFSHNVDARDARRPRHLRAPGPGPGGERREGVTDPAAKSAARGVAGTVGRELGRQILRGVLGSILGGRR